MDHLILPFLCASQKMMVTRLSRLTRALSTTTTAGPSTLYSYAICPFCNKVKAAARYAKLPLKTIEVNPLTKKEIQFSKAHRKVPILVKADGAVVVESDAIVQELLKDVDDAEFQSEDATKWARWATDDLAVVMYPNITRSFAECRRALAYTQTKFPPLQAAMIQWIGAFGMTMAHGAIKKKYNITDERKALIDKLTIWQTQLTTGPFRGGRPTPDLGDLTVFGVLAAVNGLPAHTEILDAMPTIQSWHDNMDAILPPLQEL